MDLKFNALVDYIKDKKLYYESRIENAERTHFAGYKDTIRLCKIEISKLDEILNKAEELNNCIK